MARLVKRRNRSANSIEAYATCACILSSCTCAWCTCSCTTCTPRVSYEGVEWQNRGVLYNQRIFDGYNDQNSTANMQL